MTTSVTTRSREGGKKSPSGPEILQYLRYFAKARQYLGMGDDASALEELDKIPEETNLEPFLPEVFLEG